MFHPPFALLEKNSSGSADTDMLKITALLEKEGEVELKVMAPGRNMERTLMQSIISGFFPGTVVECIVDGKVNHKKSGLHVWMVRIAEASRSAKHILEIIQAANAQAPANIHEAGHNETPEA